MAGRLIMVVGPSGVGKDTLLTIAADRLESRTDIVFPKRLVTRDTDKSLEDHLSISRETFDQMRAEHDYTLAWEAHGLGYIIPAQVLKYIALGKSAVFNGSRHAISEAVTRYPDTAVIAITASHSVRAHRLASRGRETAEQVEARLNREGVPMTAGATHIEIDNSGHIADSATQFVDAIIHLARQPTSETVS